MKKLLQCAAVAGMMGALSEEAHAGFGSTAYMTFSSDGAGQWAPSLDYRYKGLVLQLPVLNLVGGLTSKTIDLGLAVSGIVSKGSMSNSVDGVFMLGGNIGYYGVTGGGGNNSGAFHLLMKGRLGAEVKKGERNGMGFGIYVVPEIGISNYTDYNLNTSARDLGLAYGGGLEISVWYAGR